MASTVTNLTQNFTQGAAEAFAYRTAPLKAFANAQVLDGCNLNDIVRIPFVSASTAASPTFAHSTGYVLPDSYVNGVAITLGTWSYQEWAGSDNDMAKLTPESVTALGRKLGNKLGHDVIAAICKTTGSFTNNTVASGSAYSAATQMVALGTLASTQRWPIGERSILASPALYWKMAANTTTLLANSYGSPSVVQNGVLSSYYGFNVYEVDSIPSTCKGLMVASDAIGVAISVPTPQAGHDLLEVRRLTAPDGNDLPIQYVKYYDTAKRTMIHVFETIYGSAVLNSSAGYNLLVTDIDV